MPSDADFVVDPERLVHVPCAVCGASAGRPAYPVRDPLLNGDFLWSFVRCESCGHGYIDPRPSPALLDELYARLFEGKRIDGVIWSQTSSFDRSLQRARVKAIQAAMEGRPVQRVLDVGCGVGCTLERLVQAYPGLDAQGTDGSEVMTELANRREGIHVTAQRFMDRPLERESLDVLCMNHVLEHLFDPRAELERAAEWIKPGGVIQIEVPQLEGWGRSTFRRWWWCHLPPQHLQLFSEDGLRRLLCETGFPEIVSVASPGLPLNFTVFWLFFLHFTVGGMSRLRRHPLIQYPATLLGLVGLPVTLLADLFFNGALNAWRGDLLRIVARRAELGPVFDADGKPQTVAAAT